jgi:hypothetical protein
MARTRWPSDLEPRPLAQARQIRPAAPVGAKGTWGPADRSFRKTTSGVSRIAGQAGTQATDPTPHQTKAREAGPEALTHILPAESERLMAALLVLVAVRGLSGSVRSAAG